MELLRLLDALRLPVWLLSAQRSPRASEGEGSVTRQSPKCNSVHKNETWASRLQTRNINAAFTRTKHRSNVYSPLFSLAG